MIATSQLLTVLGLALSSRMADAAFGVSRPQAVRPARPLYLEDHIADMIDKELYRLQHKKEFEDQWQKRNKAVTEPKLPQNFDFDDSYMTEDVLPVQRAKDKRLAKKDPQAYCADRCIATGNCDVYEDIFDFTAEQVMQFCEECVLSEDEEPCDVPESFFDSDSKSTLRP